MERRLAAVLAADMVGYSRLIEFDQMRTLARQKAHRREFIDPEIRRNQGNIVKTTGDGLLAEFRSADDAMRAAIGIQNGMRRRESESSEDSRIQYRIGINVGDVIFDDDDVFGDSVNVAARLEAMAAPGGVCISDAMFQMVQDGISHPFNDLGFQKIKNISRMVRVWQWTGETKTREPVNAAPGMNQNVRFCITDDGVQLAYARVGSGLPIMKAPNWLNHLDYEWRSPIWGPMWKGLSRTHELVRFDQRCGGLSDWDVPEVSFDLMVSDLATVADAAGLAQFALLGISQGASYSIAYAVANPERVKCLILLGGYARGRLMRNDPKEAELYEAARTMIRQGWGSRNRFYREMFTSSYIPDATPEQKSGLDELQRVSVSAENAVRIGDNIARVDVVDLARKVSVPTLVLHTEEDRIAPLDEGRRLAALIPNARFVLLEGGNHALVDRSPAFDHFLREVEAFLKEHES